MKKHRAFMLFVCAGLFLVSAHAQTPLEERDQRRLADGFFSRGLYDLALEEYQNLLDQVPKVGNRDVILFRTAESARQLQQLDQASGYYRQVIESAPESERAQRSRYRLAEIALGREEYEEAIQQLMLLVDSNPKPFLDAPARFMLGQAYEEEKRLPEAIEQYEFILETYPEKHLAEITALRLAMVATDSPKKQRAAYQRVLGQDVSDEMKGEALWGLARLETSQKRVDAAATLLWKLYTELPNHSRVQKEKLMIAWAQLQAEEFENALALYEETSEEERKAQEDTWVYLRAVSLQRLGREEEARKAYRYLLNSFDQSRFRAIAGYEFASLSAAAGDHERVLRLSKEVMQVPGRQMDGLWLLAESARASGNEEKAIELYGQLLKEYPESPRVPDAMFLQAILLRETNPGVSAETLEAFAKRYPKQERAVEALRMAGDLVLAEKQDEKAHELWTKALMLSEEPDAGLLRRTAYLAVRLERNDDAETTLKRLLSMDIPREEKGDAHYWLGVVLKRKGNADAANAQFTKALSNHPKAEWADRARLQQGQFYQQSGKDKEALDAFLPLVGESETPLPDGLVVWLLDVAQRESTPQDQLKLAKALQQKDRPNLLKEGGAYAEAEAFNAMRNSAKAIEAWQRGLDFNFSSVEAAEAALALGEVLVSVERWEEALKAFARAASTASEVERGRIQAEALAGMGKVEQARENWEAAGKHFLTVSVLFDDNDLVPACLEAAAECFDRAGQPERAAAARRERNERYPTAVEPDTM